MISRPSPLPISQPPTHPTYTVFTVLAQSCIPYYTNGDDLYRRKRSHDSFLNQYHAHNFKCAEILFNVLPHPKPPTCLLLLPLPPLSGNSNSELIFLSPLHTPSPTLYSPHLSSPDQSQSHSSTPPSHQSTSPHSSPRTLSPYSQLPTKLFFPSSCKCELVMICRWLYLSLKKRHRGHNNRIQCNSHVTMVITVLHYYTTSS